MLEGYLCNFVNYNQNDWYQLLPLAEYACKNSKASAHKLTPFFANYGFHPQTEWMKERDVQNPGATMYNHWMQTVQNKARKTLEQTREAMKKYYDQRATPQPDIDIGDLVMLTQKRSEPSARRRNSVPDYMDQVKYSKNEETEVSNSISRQAGKSTLFFTYHCSNRTKSLIDLTENNPRVNPKMSKATWNGRLKKSYKVK